MTKIAFIFPGQGAQYPGMGQSFFNQFPESKEIFDQANETLGFNLTKKMFEGTEEELKQTEVTQPSIFTVSCAAFKIITTQAPHIAAQCAYTAGHSLGEYSALYATEAFDFTTGIKLVKYRGEFIQDCCKQQPGTMAAILGCDQTELGKLCAQFTQNTEFCEMVNFNTADQIVIAGTQNAVQSVSTQINSMPGKKNFI